MKNVASVLLLTENKDRLRGGHFARFGNETKEAMVHSQQACYTAKINLIPVKLNLILVYSQWNKSKSAKVRITPLCNNKLFKNTKEF